MAMSEDLARKYKSVFEKYPLNQEEKELIDKSIDQIKAKVITLGALGMAFGTFSVYRGKNPSLLKGILLSTGFGFVGSQIGLVAGVYSAQSQVRKLPDQAKIRNIYNELVKIAAEEKGKNPRGLPILQPPRGSQTSSNVNTLKENSNEPDGLFYNPEPASKDVSSWDSIRQANSSNQTQWDRIRQNGSTLSQQNSTSETPNWDDNTQADSTSFNEISQSDTTFGYEAAKGRSKASPALKRNKYGDIIELPDESLENVKYTK